MGHPRVSNDDWNKLRPMESSNQMDVKVYCEECGRVYCCYGHSPQPQRVDENGFGVYHGCGMCQKKNLK